MEIIRNWYIIYTKPKQEKKVAELLERKKIVSYIPKAKRIHNWHGKEKVIITDVFPSMLFVNASEQEQITIKKIDGVVGVLFWLQKPAIIQNDEIFNLQQFLNAHSDIVVEKMKVTLSPSSDYALKSDKVFDISGEHRKLILPSIGYSLSAKTVINEEIRVTA